MAKRVSTRLNEQVRYFRNRYCTLRDPHNPSDAAAHYWRARCREWGLDYDALHANKAHWAVVEQEIDWVSNGSTVGVRAVGSGWQWYFERYGPPEKKAGPVVESAEVAWVGLGRYLEPKVADRFHGSPVVGWP